MIRYFLILISLTLSHFHISCISFRLVFISPYIYNYLIIILILYIISVPHSLVSCISICLTSGGVASCRCCEREIRFVLAVHMHRNRVSGGCRIALSSLLNTGYLLYIVILALIWRNSICCLWWQFQWEVAIDNYWDETLFTSLVICDVRTLFIILHTLFEHVL